MVEEIRQSGLLHVDETAWRESRQLLWLWVFSTSSVVVYWIAYRTAELLQNVLGENYPGWLMSDGYLPAPLAPPRQAGRLYRVFQRRLRCWAHNPSTTVRRNRAAFRHDSER